MTKVPIENLVINSPYLEPAQHFLTSADGEVTGEIDSRRRPSKLRRALRADISDEAWDTVNSTISRPFPRPKTGKLAVKVINHYGDEVMKVFGV